MEKAIDALEVGDHAEVCENNVHGQKVRAENRIRPAGVRIFAHANAHTHISSVAKHKGGADGGGGQYLRPFLLLLLSMIEASRLQKRTTHSTHYVQVAK